MASWNPMDFDSEVNEEEANVFFEAIVRIFRSSTMGILSRMKKCHQVMNRKM